MSYVRKKPKGFGQNALIEGDVPVGKRTLLVEDLTTDGQSKIRFANALRDAGAIVNHAFVVFFYGVFPGAFQTLADMDITLHSLCTWWDVLEACKDRPYFCGLGTVGGTEIPGKSGCLVCRTWWHRLGRGSHGPQGCR